MRSKSSFSKRGYHVLSLPDIFGLQVTRVAALRILGPDRQGFASQLSLCDSTSPLKYTLYLHKSELLPKSLLESDLSIGRMGEKWGGSTG